MYIVAEKTKWKICTSYQALSQDLESGRLLARWESRSPIDGHFSEKINMNNCIQRFSLQI